MWILNCIFLCVVLTSAVKLDLQGALTLGSEVAEFLAHHLKTDNVQEQSGRRAMTNALEELQKVVRQMRPCKNVTICTPKLEGLIINYASDMTAAVKSIFDGVLEDELCKVKYFQKCLKHLKKVVRMSGANTDEVYRWINVLKKISGVFLEQAVLLTKQGLDKQEKKEEAANTLKQQLVIKISEVEKKYEVKLCKDLSLCPYQFDATIYLQLLLNLIKTMNDNNVKLFLNQFKINFLDAPLFNEDVTVKKNFKDVLKEMLLSKTMAVKSIILSIAEVVQKRLTGAESKETDAVLLHMILSDMDHMYVNNKDEHIEKFLNVVKEWLKTPDEVILRDGMQAFYNGLAALFLNQPSELVYKLKTEVQVFLGITKLAQDTTYRYLKRTKLLQRATIPTLGKGNASSESQSIKERRLPSSVRDGF